jgi:UDP-N-acetylglucosamine diphosphorylase/glucosamine-1-phosphate N-acetyltransferase
MTEIGLIMAAGKGTRMKSDLPKPVVELKGKPLAQYIIEAFHKAGINQVALVVGYKSDIVKQTLGKNNIYIEQNEQKGTGHAIMQTKDHLDWQDKDLFIFVGDSPLITSSTINRLKEHHNKTNADCTFLSAEFKIYLPYGRIIRDENGQLVKCVEEKNASPEELKIRELLSSHFIFKANSLYKYLFEITPDPDNGEYYLTDILEIFIKHGLKVEILKIDDYEELVGLNTPEDISWAEQILEKRENGSAQ